MTDLYKMSAKALEPYKQFEDPRLDLWRQEVHRTPTSWLITMMHTPQHYLEHVFGYSLDKLHGIGPAEAERAALMAGAAGLIIAEELDRRIPIPGFKSE